MGAFKSIRRIGALTLGMYVVLKVGSCCYNTYNAMEEKGPVNAVRYALSEAGRYMKQNGERLEEVGTSLEKVKPEEKQPDLEQKVAQPEYGPQPPPEKKQYGPQPEQQVQEQPKKEEKGWASIIYNYFFN